MKLNFFPLMVLLLLSCNKASKDNFKKENIVEVDTASLNDIFPVNSKTEILNDKENKSIAYFAGDSIFVTIKKRDMKSISFDLLFNKKNVKGTADLVMLEDNGKYYIPEGTPILDENTQEEYVCDSTYSFDNKNLNLTFAIENITKKRLSFIVSNSGIKSVNDGFYTLYKK